MLSSRKHDQSQKWSHRRSQQLQSVSSAPRPQIPDYRAKVHFQSRKDPYGSENVCVSQQGLAVDEAVISPGAMVNWRIHKDTHPQFVKKVSLVISITG
ncbi:uncharacterized protein BDW70DRAFT_135754 [Aspergillus foveolatus]|uniref:uncharacterized protein n=1 Tax=Aspergillus foveolatus TaxID=210207 RepID=UPI003CCD0772